MTDWRENYRWYTHETLALQCFRYGILRVVNWPLMQIERLDFDKMPPQGGCIMACNHVSNFDPYILGTYLKRHPHFMAKSELFESNVFSWIARTAGAFPIYRKQKDDWAMKQAGKILKDGAVLLMFPEGTRSGKEAKLQRGKTGVVRLAFEHQVPIVPMSIFGTHHLKRGWRTQNHIRLQLGDPMDVVSMSGTTKPTAKLVRQLTNEMMTRIAALLPPEHRGVYGDSV